MVCTYFNLCFCVRQLEKYVTDATLATETDKDLLDILHIFNKNEILGNFESRTFVLAQELLIIRPCRLSKLLIQC